MYFTKCVPVVEILDDLSVSLEEVGFTEESSEMRLELELEFELTVHSMGSPAVMYLANGDPGYPAEGPEYEIELLTRLDLWDSDALELVVGNWVDLNYEALAEEAFNQFNEGDE